MDQYEDVMNRLNNNRPVLQRDPYVEAGQHDLIIESIETYSDRKLVDGAYTGYGPAVRATFIVEKSTTVAPGTRCIKTWSLFKPAKYPNKPTDADQFADFVTVLQGLPQGQHQASCFALLKTRQEGGQYEAQIARGARISCRGQEVGKPNATTGKRYVAVSWQTKQQDNAMIAATRAQLDAAGGPWQPRQEHPQQVQQQPMQQQWQQQASQQWGQPQPNMQPQQPQFAPQPAPQQWQQPQVQQGYVQQPAPAQQPTPVQGAPAAGFLSLIPQK